MTCSFDVPEGLLCSDWVSRICAEGVYIALSYLIIFIGNDPSVNCLTSFSEFQEWRMPSHLMVLVAVESQFSFQGFTSRVIL